LSADLEWLKEDEEEAGHLIANALDQKEKAEFQFHWQLLARREQCAPEGDWRIWMIMAGRGFGKTRAGAEWVRLIAEEDPTARIALVAASLAEARAVMVEGESGLMAVCPPDRMPHFEPSLHRVRFANGAQVQLFSASEPESLRGLQHSHACRSVREGILRQSGARDL
jgi:phage terminase large subunit-like protein